MQKQHCWQGLGPKSQHHHAPLFSPSLCLSSTHPVPLLLPLSSLPHPITEQQSSMLPLPGQLLTMWSTCWWKNQLVKMTFFLFTEQKNTGYLKSCGNRHTQSPMIWLKCSLSNCLCGCCVDKAQTNYSVGRWLSAQQQSVGVMDRRCSQMGSLGRGNHRCCPLNPGLYLLLVKAPKENCCFRELTAHGGEQSLRTWHGVDFAPQCLLV